LPIAARIYEAYGISATPNIPHVVKIQIFPDFPDVFTDPLHDIPKTKRILRISKVSDELLFFGGVVPEAGVQSAQNLIEVVIIRDSGSSEYQPDGLV
jgi:hypothetical protein